MPVYNRKKMCAECPFSAKSIPGWLGPWSIEDFENFLKFDGTFICHMDVERLHGEEDAEDHVFDEEVEKLGQHCVGMLRYMNSMCKLSRDPEKAAAQNVIRETPDKPVIQVPNFREHHTLRKKNEVVGRRRKTDAK